MANCSPTSLARSIWRQWPAPSPCSPMGMAIIILGLEPRFVRFAVNTRGKALLFLEKITKIAAQKWQPKEHLIIKQAFNMTKAEIENKLSDLKKQQGEHFKQKKAVRNADSIKTIREEMNTLKNEVTKIYRGK